MVKLVLALLSAAGVALGSASQWTTGDAWSAYDAPADGFSAVGAATATCPIALLLPLASVAESCLGDSRVRPESKERGGRNEVAFCGECPLAEPCGLCCRPSICAGSEGGRWPSGGSSLDGCAESYEFDRPRVNAGFGGR